MSLFNLFKKKEKGPVIEDKIWMNKTSKLKGCADMVRKKPSLILIAWLEQTKEEVQNYLSQEHGLSPTIELAGMLIPSRMSGKEMCFLEHHPLFSKEQTLLNTLKCEKMLFLNSLEDAVFYHSKPERIMELMQRMGMKEDELIEHAMVSKSISRAQQKFDKDGIGNLPEKYGDWRYA